MAIRNLKTPSLSTCGYTKQSSLHEMYVTDTCILLYFMYHKSVFFELPHLERGSCNLSTINVEINEFHVMLFFRGHKRMQQHTLKKSAVAYLFFKIV